MVEKSPVSDFVIVGRVSIRIFYFHFVVRADYRTSATMATIEACLLTCFGLWGEFGMLSNIGHNVLSTIILLVQ